MFQQIMQYLGYARTGVWLWTLVSTSAIGVAIWAYLARLPLVIVAVLALGTGVLVLIGVETAKRLRGRRYRRAVAALDNLRTEGVVLRNRQVHSVADVQAFVDDLKAFEAKALTAMRGAATRTAISWFRDLHEWTAPGVDGYNDEHKLMRAIIDEKLRRMHTIAQQIETKIR